MGRASRKKSRPRAGNGNLYSKLDLNGLNDARSMYKKVEKGRLINPQNGELYTIPSLHRQMIELNLHDPDKIGAVTSELASMFYLYKNLYHNYFITSENIVDFIENQKISKKDIVYLSPIMQEYCPSKKHKYSLVEFYAAAIHLVNRKYSLFFHMSKGIKPGDFSLKISDMFALYYMRNDNCGSNDMGYIHLGDHDDLEETLDLVSDSETKKNWNIIFNMFLYIDAFPEAIRKGPPPITLPYGMTPLSNTTIGLSKSIRQMYADRSVSPHMRRGYYRFLQSDRYKKKRFQTIYVRPSMVKGTADHVIDVTEKSEVI